jgi:hypothetical protein
VNPSTPLKTFYQLVLGQIGTQPITSWFSVPIVYSCQWNTTFDNTILISSVYFAPTPLCIVGGFDQGKYPYHTPFTTWLLSSAQSLPHGSGEELTLTPSVAVSYSLPNGTTPFCPGNNFTLIGQFDFNSSYYCTFNDVLSPPAEFISSTRLVCQLPTGLSGAVTYVVVYELDEHQAPNRIGRFHTAFALQSCDGDGDGGDGSAGVAGIPYWGWIIIGVVGVGALIGIVICVGTTLSVMARDPYYLPGSRKDRQYSLLSSDATALQ